MKPRIAVIGVGGAGGNAVNNMIAAGLQGAEFMVANTDAQALEASSAERHIQLGSSLTEGLGAGSKPEIGEAAAEEALEDIRSAIAGTHMVFVAAGMGGGTGTGAASVIARVAKEFGILTVAVVTKPFTFEGSRRMRVAEAGIAELKRHVDTLLVIPNQNLFRIATDRTTFAEAFVLADQVLYSGIACIVDLIVKEGLINLDLADVKTVLSGMGTAMMGTGEAAGEQRSIVAAEEAIVNPLLDDITLKGAKSLLLSITGGRDLTLWEVDEAANRVRQEVDPDANIIVGATFDENLGERVRVSIVASGMTRNGVAHAAAEPTVAWPSRASRAQPPPAAPDYQHRLSEAIGQAVGHSDPARTGNEQTWQAPGGVYIQQTPPHLASTASATKSANRASNSQEQTHDGRPGASPASGQARHAAADDQAPGSRRDYWAKNDERQRSKEAPTVYQRPVEAPAPKTSLLRRITGVGRKRDQDAADQRSSRPSGRSQHNEEHVDLPVFFGQGKD
jgi:cell division protein FtsZ